VHIWDVVHCTACGAKKLIFPAFLNRKDRRKRYPTTEFTWLTLFITQLIMETGHIETKKQLINDSLDQMHWSIFLMSRCTSGDNYFSISYKNNEFLRYEWDFKEAVGMFQAMNGRAQAYFAPHRTAELNQKLAQLEELKQTYRSLMEISSQAGVSGEVAHEIEQLSAQFKKLSKELEDLV
jgi:hypothetical protein